MLSRNRPAVMESRDEAAMGNLMMIVEFIIL